MNFTNEELIAISYALQFSIENSTLNDYEDTELLFSLDVRINEFLLTIGYTL